MIQDLVQDPNSNPNSSGVARAFPGGQFAHPENQNEEKNQ